MSVWVLNGNPLTQGKYTNNSAQAELVIGGVADQIQGFGVNL